MVDTVAGEMDPEDERTRRLIDLSSRIEQWFQIYPDALVVDAMWQLLCIYAKIATDADEQRGYHNLLKRFVDLTEEEPFDHVVKRLTMQ